MHISESMPYTNVPFAFRKKNMIMFLLQFCGAGGFLLVIFTDTQSPILQGRAAEVPYRKRVARLGAKIMPFIYFQSVIYSECVFQ